MNFPNLLIRSLYEEIQVDSKFSIWPLRISRFVSSTEGEKVQNYSLYNQKKGGEFHGAEYIIGKIIYC